MNFHLDLRNCKDIKKQKKSKNEINKSKTYKRKHDIHGNRHIKYIYNIGRNEKQRKFRFLDIYFEKTNYRLKFRCPNFLNYYIKYQNLLKSIPECIKKHSLRIKWIKFSEKRKNKISEVQTENLDEIENSEKINKRRKHEKKFTPEIFSKREKTEETIIKFMSI